MWANWVTFLHMQHRLQKGRHELWIGGLEFGLCIHDESMMCWYVLQDNKTICCLTCLTFAVTFGRWPTGPSLEMIWVDMLQTQTAADLWVSGAQVRCQCQSVLVKSPRWSGEAQRPSNNAWSFEPSSSCSHAESLKREDREQVRGRIYGNDDSSW